MKKLLLLLVATVVLLAACTGTKEASPGTKDGDAKKEITIWAWDPKFNIAALELAKKEYAKKNPDVKVNIVEFAQADIIQKLNTGLNSGTKTGLPNIVLIEDYRAQGFLQSYPEFFHDMTSSVKAADFADYKAGPTSSKGKQYGIPFDTGVAGLYVRTDYLKEAGYSVADLQDIDWKQFIEIGQKVKEKTGKHMLSLDPNDLGIVRMMLQSAGSWYMKEDGSTPYLSDNATLKVAFQTYKDMMKSGIVNVHSDWSQFVGTMNSGAVASVPTGNWITPSIKAEASQSGKWAVVPMPKLANVANATHYTNLGGSSWYVMNVDGQDTAADFMAQTFGANADLYQSFVKDIGAIGTLKKATSGEAYTAKDDFFAGQTIVSDFASWNEKIPSVNYGQHTYAIEDILVVEMQNFMGGKSLDDVLKNAQKTADAQLK